MKWRGTYQGLKGYKSWKFKTSVMIIHFPPGARHYKNGLFSLIYRFKGDEEPDKRAISAGIREILGSKGRYLTYIQSGAHTVTIEHYCFVDALPEESQMVALEDYLHNVSF